MSKRQLFNLTYRYIFPVVILLAFFAAPVSMPSTRARSMLEWLVLVWIALPVIAIYPGVTLLDQAPSSDIPYWKRGLWRRYGDFRGDEFISFYDPSSLPFFYLYHALIASLVTSLLIALGLPLLGIAPLNTSIILALIHFILTYTPYFVFYRAFLKAMFP